MKITNAPWLLALSCLCLVSACGKKQDAAGHDHGGGHVHTAPHGGTLVELGDHQFNLELVQDAVSGKLTAYVLDAHAESFVRVNQLLLELSFTGPMGARPLSLVATGNAATGEIPGSTSQFEGSATWLKVKQRLTGVVSTIDIRGANFSQIHFTLGAEPAF